MEQLLPVLVACATLLLLVVAGGLFVWKCYRRIGLHQALVVNGPSGMRVHLRKGAVVLPFVHQAEVLDLSTQVLTLTLTGAQSVQCKNNLRADVRARVLLRVNQTAGDVEKLMSTLGVKATTPEVLRQVFEARFSEAFRTVFRCFDFEECLQKREEVRDQVVQVVGRDLSGFTLEDLQVEQLSETPLSFYDSNNILDAMGIRLITERTSMAHVMRVELEMEARTRTARLQLEADLEQLRIEQDRARVRQEADALAGKPPPPRSAVDAQAEAVRARAAELEASFRRKLEKPQADGRTGSGSGGAEEDIPFDSGFQAGFRKT
ncbi:SPFH domain-containing protein [Pyxidicoccus sp. 3LG]